MKSQNDPKLFEKTSFENISQQVDNFEQLLPIRTINAISGSVPSYPPPRPDPFWPKIWKPNIMFHFFRREDWGSPAPWPQAGG